MEFLNIDEILPNQFQPRKEFDMEQLAQLAKSIKEYGIIEPLIVRINNNDEFELIAGERRLRAAKMAGLDKVPIILKDYDDDKVAQIALIENLQRSNLNVIEEANAYQLLLHKFNLKQEEVAQKVGKSRSHIANFVRLLNSAKDGSTYKNLSFPMHIPGQHDKCVGLEERGYPRKDCSFASRTWLPSQISAEINCSQY